VEHITANGKVTIIEVVNSGPTNRAELSTTKDERVEHAQTEDKCFELWFLVAFRFIVVRLWELAECTTQVSLEVLRGFI
jgi:hypothetical protein